MRSSWFLNDLLILRLYSLTVCWWEWLTVGRSFTSPLFHNGGIFCCVSNQHSPQLNWEKINRCERNNKKTDLLWSASEGIKHVSYGVSSSCSKLFFYTILILCAVKTPSCEKSTSPTKKQYNISDDFNTLEWNWCWQNSAVSSLNHLFVKCSYISTIHLANIHNPFPKG